jgi:hypothetical protein
MFTVVIQKLPEQKAKHSLHIAISRSKFIL